MRYGRDTGVEMEPGTHGFVRSGSGVMQTNATAKSIAGGWEGAGTAHPAR